MIDVGIVFEIVRGGAVTTHPRVTTITISNTSSVHGPIAHADERPVAAARGREPVRDGVRVLERVAGSEWIVPPPKGHAFAHAHEFAHGAVLRPGS
jgi:hypothetical protein